MYPCLLVLPHLNKTKHGVNVGKDKMWLVLITKVLCLPVGVTQLG